MHRILILGLAREGASLARFLSSQGVHVTVTDSAPPECLRERIDSIGDDSVRYVLGGHHSELVEQVDSFYVSPGIPESNPIYQAAVRRGVPIRSMTTLFFELCPGPILGVTGTSGKTTTTSLIGHILQSAGRDCAVGGNIGDPMIDLLPHITTNTTVVLELSSFQLALLDRSPHIAVVTNISPNHLDRHSSMTEYIAAKLRIVRNQLPEDHALLNSSDEQASLFARNTPATVGWFGNPVRGERGATVHGDAVGLLDDRGFRPVMNVADIPLLGWHNRENVLAACAATAVLGVSPAEMASAIRTYRPPPHRLQTVSVQAGVRFIDDSIATSPTRAGVALEAIGPDDRALNPGDESSWGGHSGRSGHSGWGGHSVVLIAGGRDKGLPWDDLARLIARKTRALLLIGEAASMIDAAVRTAIASAHAGADSPAGADFPCRLDAGAIHHCESLPAAVKDAAAIARPGDVVLLSPGCASYDMFKDFEERGTVFARAVESVHAA